VHPATEAEVQEVVRSAIGENNPILCAGGGTRIAFGAPLTAENWTLLCTDRLVSEFDFSPDDMVVTVGAGTTLQQLQNRLAEQGQFLPVDIPHPHKATVGGVLAANTHGLWRPGWGSLRDRLIGIRVVTGTGEAVKSGGRVVKNVAGYDMGKLFIGSFGTLGIITQAVFRTSPRPQAAIWRTFRAESAAQAVDLLLKVHAAHLQPTAAQVVCAGGVETVCIGLHGSDKQTAWQLESITRILNLPPCEGPAETEVLHLLEDSQVGSRVRIVTSPERTADIIAALSAADTVSASVPVGIVEATFSPDIDPVAQSAYLTRHLHQMPVVVSWPLLPMEAQARMSPWPALGKTARLHEGVRRTLDPHRILSPGRFAGEA
jgi:glycolate oxidase FAD binding subunit